MNSSRLNKNSLPTLPVEYGVDGVLKVSQRGLWGIPVVVVRVLKEAKREPVVMGYQSCQRRLC